MLDTGSIGMKHYFVYILASSRNGTLYVGMTSNLIRRIWEHKNAVIKGFTQKYRINRLVYFEETSDVGEALKREKLLKRWKREWKLELIEKQNSDWNDLYEKII